MVYNQELANRVHNLLISEDGLTEKKMFGGVGYMLHGNMACGVIGDGLIVHLGKERYAQALQEPNTRPFDMTGRPMSGWLVVDASGVETEEQLESWVRQGVDFARTL
jgi:TfoX/Sxy family transcriptional regulator of competence genes